eukprot:g33349.t1
MRQSSGSAVPLVFAIGGVAHGDPVGPCIDESKPQANAKAAAPPVDLLDMGDSKPTPAKPAEQADLLNFEGSKAPEKRQDIISSAAPVPSS